MILRAFPDCHNTIPKPIPSKAFEDDPQTIFQSQDVKKKTTVLRELLQTSQKANFLHIKRKLNQLLYPYFVQFSSVVICKKKWFQWTDVEKTFPPPLTNLRKCKEAGMGKWARYLMSPLSWSMFFFKKKKSSSSQLSYKWSSSPWTQLTSLQRSEAAFVSMLSSQVVELQVQ